MIDDPSILEIIGSGLEREGYHVTTADSGKAAIELINEKEFDLVITDLVMEPINGIGVLKRVKEINPEIMVMILTGFGEMPSAIDALRLNADDYLLKPVKLEELFFRVSLCLKKKDFWGAFKTT